MQSANIEWYGERGAVNRMLVSWGTGAALCDRIARFLGAIAWYPDQARAPQNLVRATVLVEPSLADFGSPDLVISTETGDGRRHAYFVEAKLSRYAASAIRLGPTRVSEPGEKQGMAIAGFNSSINGQLDLKHRFARAYVGSRGMGKIVEAREAAAHYAEVFLDPLPGRKLVKPSVVDLIERVVGDVKEDGFHFIAFTGDEEWPLTDPDRLPRLGGALDRLGWIGLGDPCALGTGRPGGPLEDQQLEPIGEYIRTVRIAEPAKEMCAPVEARWVQLGGKTKPLPGSIDLDLNDERRIKLVPFTGDHRRYRAGLHVALDGENTALCLREAEELGLQPVVIGGRQFYSRWLARDQITMPVALESLMGRAMKARG